MIKIENTEVNGWEPAIRGARNPMNSWDKSDSKIFRGAYIVDGKPGLQLDYRNILDEQVKLTDEDKKILGPIIIGPNDLSLLMRLAKACSVEAKYRRMIVVYCDITAPLYWWKEFDTYKVGTVANSCSTMHKIHAKEFTLEDFSYEHLGYLDLDGTRNEDEQKKDNDIADALYGMYPLDHLANTIDLLNVSREMFIETKDKHYWWQMIQLLPSSYNQRRTVMMNYEVLTNIYKNRKDHKLDEWREFCEWIRKLPFSEIITLEEKNG